MTVEHTRQPRPCGMCGATDGVRPYKDGPCCPAHTPAALAGHPETTPDPERTLAGILRAHGIAPDRSLTPASETLVDTRRKAAGKTRTSPHAYRAARADVEDRAELERARRARATTGARDGDTYRDFDYARLNGQAKRVFDVMRDGKWRTLDELAAATGDPATSCQSRLRDFRKPQFGSLAVDTEKPDGSNLWRYRLVLPDAVQLTLPDESKTVPARASGN